MHTIETQEGGSAVYAHGLVFITAPWGELSVRSEKQKHKIVKKPIWVSCGTCGGTGHLSGATCPTCKGSSGGWE
jgi:hypothetical protein